MQRHITLFAIFFTFISAALLGIWMMAPATNPLIPDAPQVTILVTIYAPAQTPTPPAQTPTPPATASKAPVFTPSSTSRSIATVTLTPTLIATAKASPVITITTTATPYLFSRLQGDGNLIATYPLSATWGNFLIHYQQNSLVSRENELETVFRTLEDTQNHINATLMVSFSKPVHVYLGDRLFAPPNQALHGHAYSSPRSFFVLYNDTSSPAFRRYIIAHELTHVIAAEMYGPPGSVMLSEGLAVQVAYRFLLSEPFLPMRDFCYAYLKVNKLPFVSSNNLAFEGHVMSLDSYYAAGCFVEYLMTIRSPLQIKAVYTNLNYSASYGKTLKQLEDDWRNELGNTTTQLSFLPTELIARYGQFRNENQLFLAQIEKGKIDPLKQYELEQRWLKIMQRATP